MHLAKAFDGESHQTLNINGACVTYFAVEGCAGDVAGCEDKGVGPETERDIL